MVEALKSITGKHNLTHGYANLIAHSVFRNDASCKKGYLSLRRKTQFATLHPSTLTRVDIGLKLNGVEPAGRFEAAGSWNGMMSHRVRLASAREVDAELADAEDLAPDFLPHAFEKEWFARYDAERGRFRTFLRSCLVAFASTRAEAADPRKRGGGAVHVSVEHIDLANRANSELDSLFEHEWARSTLTESIAALRRECSDVQRDVTLRVFVTHDIDGADMEPKPTYASIAATFGIPVTQVTNYLNWARRRFRAHVLATLRALTATDSEFRADARVLFGVDVHDARTGTRAPSCGSPTADALHRHSGRRRALHRARVDRTRWHGSRLSCHRSALDRDAALKVLSLDAETPSLAKRLVREARVLAQLEHPGIAAIHDAGTLSDGRPNYLMRMVRGESLAKSQTLGARGDRLRMFLSRHVAEPGCALPDCERARGSRTTLARCRTRLRLSRECGRARRAILSPQSHTRVPVARVCGCAYHHPCLARRLTPRTTRCWNSPEFE